VLQTSNLLAFHLFKKMPKNAVSNYIVEVHQNQKSTLLNVKYVVYNNPTIKIQLLDKDCNPIQELCNEKQKSGFQQIFYDISFLPRGNYIIDLNGIQKIVMKN
jgi:hypothetical protein